MTASVRTFRAASMRGALVLVKRALGPGAIILGTRSVPAGNLGRLVGRDHVEITAAPPDTPACAPRLAVKAPKKAAGKPADADPRGAAKIASRTPRSVDLPRAADAAQTSAIPALPGPVHQYFIRLVQNEVAEDLAARVLKAATDAVPASMRRDEWAVADALRQEIARLIPAPAMEEPETRGPRRIALIGPAGGGKTTTIAKLAAQFKLQQHRHIVLLSLDNHRPGASEPLRRYAEIIGVPFHTAQSVTGVKEVLRRVSDAAELLIDTPGVGLREPDRLAHLAALLGACEPLEAHLVLPACLTDGSQANITQVFTPLGVSKVVLTHLDEAVGVGVILNVVDRLKCGVSYLTNGQNVPGDIERACGKRLAELIFPVVN